MGATLFEHREKEKEKNPVMERQLWKHEFTSIRVGHRCTHLGRGGTSQNHGMLLSSLPALRIEIRKLEGTDGLKLGLIHQVLLWVLGCAA
jgi:hypothetical protein